MSLQLWATFQKWVFFAVEVVSCFRAYASLDRLSEELSTLPFHR